MATSSSGRARPLLLALVAAVLAFVAWSDRSNAESDESSSRAEWLRDGGFRSDVPLFTQESQQYFRMLPMTSGFNAHILLSEYGHAFTVDTRDDLALMTFTTTPLVSPHFFRRNDQGWQIDIAAEVRNTRNYSGPYTWGMKRKGDDFSERFADRQVTFGRLTRLSGGDNRALPIRGN